MSIGEMLQTIYNYGLVNGNKLTCVNLIPQPKKGEPDRVLWELEIITKYNQKYKVVNTRLHKLMPVAVDRPDEVIDI